jgi:hypothetical protein
MLMATETELAEAHRRLELIQPRLLGVAGVKLNRTQQRFLAAYKAAQLNYGNGFVGLIPKTSRSGNRKPRLRSEVIELVQDEINTHYLSKTRINVGALHGFIRVRCKACGLPAPSYGWLCKFVKAIPQDLLALARSGEKAAYKHQPRVEEKELSAALEPVRPFERVHVDHTLLDLETVEDEAWFGLGRVWITLMIDHFSRRILGVYLTYAAPGYASVLGVMRDCVRRHGRLPDSMVIDGGKEFRGVWFESTCAFFHIMIVRRPPAKARYGSQIERYFGTLNTQLIYSLVGNTQNTRNVRQLTKEFSPSRHAIWTFVALHETINSYLFEIYENAGHGGIAMSPRQKFAEGKARAGHRPQRLVADDENFRILTCPSTRSGHAKVTPDGVKINYLYYSAPELQRCLGKSVAVRFDPFNAANAYAHVEQGWVRLTARHHHVLRFYSSHYVQLVSEEWRRRRSAVEKERLSESSLVKFILEIKETEALLKQRKQEACEREWRHRVSGADDAMDVALNPEEFNAPDDTALVLADSSTQSASFPALDDVEPAMLEVY